MWRHRVGISESVASSCLEGEGEWGEMVQAGKLLGVYSFSLEQPGALGGFLHDHICSLITLPMGRRSWRETKTCVRWVSGLLWDSADVMVDGRKEGSRTVEGGKDTQENRRLRQEGPVTA